MRLWDPTYAGFAAFGLVLFALDPWMAFAALIGIHGSWLSFVLGLHMPTFLVPLQLSFWSSNSGALDSGFCYSICMHVLIVVNYYILESHGIATQKIDKKVCR